MTVAKSEWRERYRKIVDLSRRGLTESEISAQLGVSRRMVQRARVWAGIAGAPPVPLTEEEKVAAKAMLEDGASYPEVARTLGRGRTTIADHFPGYAWTNAQSIEHMNVCRHLGRKALR